MSQWGFYFDQTRCLGCKACTVACKEWNEDKRGDRLIEGEMGEERGRQYATPGGWEGPTGSGQNYAEFRRYDMKENWRRVTTFEFGTVPPRVDAVSLSLGCNHCEKPACVPVCPVQAIRKDPEFGAVLVDSAACVSCGACREACPWDVPQYYDEPSRYEYSDPKRPRMTKCTMCVDRLRVSLKPACVASCPNRALDFGPLEELRRRYPEATPTATGFKAEDVARTGPSILFRARTPRA